MRDPRHDTDPTAPPAAAGGDPAQARPPRVRLRSRARALARHLLTRPRALASRLRPRRVLYTLRWWRATWREIAARRRERRFTVGVDIAAFWEPLTGVGWYLYQLLVHLADRPDLCLRLYGPSLVRPGDAAAPVVELPRGRALEVIRYEVPSDLSLPDTWLVPRMRKLEPVLVAADRNRVIFAPNYFPPRTFRLCRGALVATILDLGFHLVPWTLRQETLRGLTLHLDQVFARAERLVTISEAVRGELIAHGFSSPERVRAIHLGPGQLASIEPGPPPPGLPPRYALFVSTLEPRKNLVTLLDAWELLAWRGARPPLLVICGRYGWKSEDIQRRVEQAEARGLARHLGYLPDRQVAALYHGCELLALPSLYEGFGLPVLEAMRCGVPVVVSDLPVLREVAGDAALFADPRDAGSWAAAIGRLLADDELRRELARRGRRRAELFDWRRTAAETVEVWREADRLVGGGSGAAT